MPQSCLPYYMYVNLKTAGETSKRAKVQDFVMTCLKGDGVTKVDAGQSDE